MTRLTWISNLDANCASLEVLAITSKGGLETLEVAKLGVGKALGPVLFAVFDDPYVHNVAVFEKLGDGLGSCVIRQVAEMRSIGRLGRQFLGQIVADRVVTWNNES